MRYWDGAAWTDRTRARGGDANGGSGGADGGSSEWFRRPIVWVAALVVVAVVATGVLVLGGSAEAGEVFLEPAAKSGADPFFDSIATSAVEVDAGGVEDVEGGGASVESLRGSAPGLYGGTGDDAVCDVAALVAFLDANPAKARAFASVVGIRPGDIGRYVGSLTPVLVREDTRVTNHGFRDGAATARQAVLQAGTAVLVDDRGLPRVRCACGNPLLEPAATASTPEFQGSAWGGFDAGRLVTVLPAADAQRELALVDVTSGDSYTVPVRATVTGGGAELVLAPDGLGVADFGEPKEQVVAAITEVIGEPDEVTRSDAVGSNWTFYRWGHLHVFFHDGVDGRTSANGFVEYTFRRDVDFAANRLEPWEPAPWEEELITPEGVTIGSPQAEAEDAYPVTYSVSFLRDTCTTIQQHEGLGGLDPGESLLFVSPERGGLHLSPVIEGEVWNIGANGESFGTAFCWT